MNFLALFLSMALFPLLRSLNSDLPTRSSQIKELEIIAKSADFWVSVHAIEFLAKLGLKKEAKELARKQLKPFQRTSEKRVGYWRTRSLTSKGSFERYFWNRQIKKAYLDISGTDRIHSAESLAKLGISFKNLNHKIVNKDLMSEGMIFSFSHWGNSLPLNKHDNPNYGALIKELSHKEVKNRSLAGYGLSFLLPNMKADCWESLAHSALMEDLNSEAYVYLVGAAYIHFNKNQHHFWEIFQELRKRLLDFEYSKKKSERIELCRALANSPLYFEQDLGTIERILLSTKKSNDDVTDNSFKGVQEDWGNLDIRASAAYAWIQINLKKNNQE